MKIDFKGRTALVTGGTRGIGAAVVRALLDSGAQVIATGTSASKASGSAGLRFEKIDFSVDRETEAFASTIAEERIDVLVNNAGINKIALTGDVDIADWDRIQKVNVRAPFLLCRSLAPRMAARKYGRIVNVSSVFGHVSKSQRLSYSSSKFGLLGLTKAVSLDYAKDNVLVNAVAPGFIDTELTRSINTDAELKAIIETVPVKRLGTIDEIAKVILFLASETNSFITGQNVIADGGFTSA